MYEEGNDGWMETALPRNVPDKRGDKDWNMAKL